MPWNVNPKNYTPAGGMFVWVVNDTGGASQKGYIVEPSSTVDNGVQMTAAGDIDPIGVIYDDGIADGEMIRIIVAGIADVYYGGDVNAGTLSRVPVVADGYGAGEAINEAFPTSPFATDKHFQEIGHPLESRVGAGLAKTILHFN